jgi:hypothetical protein
MSGFLMHIFINTFHKQLSHHINKMYVHFLFSSWGQKVKADHPIQVLRNLYIKIQHLFTNILQSPIGMFMSIMELLYFMYVGTHTHTLHNNNIWLADTMCPPDDRRGVALVSEVGGGGSNRIYAIPRHFTSLTKEFG